MVKRCAVLSGAISAYVAHVYSSQHHTDCAVRLTGVAYVVNGLNSEKDGHPRTLSIRGRKWTGWKWLSCLTETQTTMTVKATRDT